MGDDSSFNSEDESYVISLIKWIMDRAIEGIPPLSGTKSLAQEYLIDRGYLDNDSRVDSLINWETTKNFTSGFVTGLGGLLTLPISVPAALGASWSIQARMAGAIAHIYGHNLDDDRIRTFVIVSLVGDSAKEVFKRAGIVIGEKLTTQVIKQIPGKLLIEINKQVGFRLLTKFGEKGVINFIKGVPIIGGTIAGTIDAASCRAVGYSAKALFKRDLDDTENMGDEG